ncbi:MAG: hypothetical protein ACREBU_16005 [Nitrososphaera sp.]
MLRQPFVILSIIGLLVLPAASWEATPNELANAWSVTDAPAQGLQAIATRLAGGTGVRHVATSIHACTGFTGAVFAGPQEVRVTLRDGTSGIGTILWTGYTSAGSNVPACINVSGLSFVGSPNTVMTLEYEAAPAGGMLQTVTLTGFSFKGSP